MPIAFLVAKVFPGSDEEVAVYKLSEGDAVHAGQIVQVVNGRRGPSVGRKCKGTLRVLSIDGLDEDERYLREEQMEKSRDEFAAAYPIYRDGKGSSGVLDKEDEAYQAPVCRNCYLLRNAVYRCLNVLRGEVTERMTPMPVPESAGPTNKVKKQDAAQPVVQTQVILWEGAEPTKRNITLARSRTAYLEAHGNVAAALETLKQDGHEIGQSTLYDHLNVLDKVNPRWRESVLLSNRPGNLENGVNLRTTQKSRGRLS